MRHSSTQVGFHVPTQKSILIEQAVKGLACDCICIECGEPLKAVKDFKTATRPYFQHHNPNSDRHCTFSGESQETELHLRAKNLIKETKELYVPDIVVGDTSKFMGMNVEPYVAFKGRVLSLDEVVLEQHQGNIIPDCIGRIDDREILIEVKVTHAVDSHKKDKIKKKKQSCLEVKIDRKSDPKDLKSILKNPDNWNWVVEWVSASENVKSQSLMWRKKKEQSILQYYEKKRPERELLVLKKRVSDFERSVISCSNYVERMKYALRDVKVECEDIFEENLPHRERLRAIEVEREIKAHEAGYAKSFHDTVIFGKSVQENLIKHLTKKGIKDAREVQGVKFSDLSSNCKNNQPDKSAKQLYFAFEKCYSREIIDITINEWHRAQNKIGRCYRDPRKGFNDDIIAVEEYKKSKEETLRIVWYELGCRELEMRLDGAYQKYNAFLNAQPKLEEAKRKYRKALKDTIKVQFNIDPFEHEELDAILDRYTDGLSFVYCTQALREFLLDCQYTEEYYRNESNYEPDIDAMKRDIGSLDHEALYEEYKGAQKWYDYSPFNTCSLI